MRQHPALAEELASVRTMGAPYPYLRLVPDAA
jgi:hypothetical protein